MYDVLYEERGDMPAVYRQLAFELDRAWISNDSKINLLHHVYTLAALASVLELLSFAALTWSNVLYS